MGTGANEAAKRRKGRRPDGKRICGTQLLQKKDAQARREATDKNFPDSPQIISQKSLKSIFFYGRMKMLYYLRAAAGQTQRKNKK